MFSKRLEEQLYHLWKNIGPWQEDENSFNKEKTIPCSSKQLTKKSRAV